MLGGFKQFILRGALIDLAVAVVVGTAFTAVVTALVSDLVTPAISAVGGSTDFSGLHFTINHSTFRYGAFINALFSFLIVAAVLFFVVIRTVNALQALGPKPEPTTRDCPECLSQIPRAARRCPQCTSAVEPLV